MGYSKARDALSLSATVLECTLLFTSSLHERAEELKDRVARHGQRHMARAQWIEMSAPLIDHDASRAVWDTFLTLGQALSSQHEESLDIKTLGVLIMLQTYKPRRNRVNSELWQDTMPSSPRESPREEPQTPRDCPRGDDWEDRVAFIKDNMSLFVHLVADNPNQVGGDEIQHVAFLFAPRVTSYPPPGDGIRRRSIPEDVDVGKILEKLALAEGDANSVARAIVKRMLTPGYVEYGFKIEELKSTWIRDTPLDRNPPMRQTARISRCYRAPIYITEPVKMITISNCTACQIVVTGCIILVIRGCSKLRIHAHARCIVLINSIDVEAYVCVQKRPVILGDSRGLKFGPGNIISSKLETSLRETNIDPESKECMISWSDPIFLSSLKIDPYASGGSLAKGKREIYTLVKPELFSVVRVPEFKQNLPVNALILPEVYRQAWAEQIRRVNEIQATVSVGPDEEEICAEVKELFCNWLNTSGKMRQIEDLRKLERKLLAE